MLDEKDLSNIREIVSKEIDEKLERIKVSLFTDNDFNSFVSKLESKKYITKYDLDEFKDKMMYFVREELSKLLTKISNK